MKITLEGACTVERAEEIRQLLLRSLSDATEAEVSFSGVTSADLSFFQLLHSAQHSYSQKGRKLTLLPNLGPRFAEKANRTGLSCIITEQ